MAGLEDVFLYREVLRVLDVAPPAPGGGGRQVGLHPGDLLQVQPGFLLLGSGVLEPDLHHSLGQADVVAQALALWHRGGLVVLEDALHYLDLHVGHVSPEPLVAAVPLSVGFIVATRDVRLAVSVKVGAEASDLLGGGGGELPHGGLQVIGGGGGGGRGGRHQ